MREPVVGVIIPCFNQGRYAAECVQSLRDQTWRRWQAVLVDDASTDDSAASLDALRAEAVSVVHLEKNLGRALVRNEAVRRLGTVDYVLNLDCDDRLTPDYLAKLVRVLEENPKAGLAYGTLRYFGSERQGTWPEEPYEFDTRHLDNRIPGPGVLFRFSALAETAGWRVEYTRHSAEDWDIWLQIVERGWRPLWVRDAIYDYRQHPGSFLAQSSEHTRVLQDLLLLRWHAEAIRRSSGLEAFLSPRVIPALAAAIHGAHLKQAADIALPLLRRAPLTTFRLLGKHYGRRLRAMLRR